MYAPRCLDLAKNRLSAEEREERGMERAGELLTALGVVLLKKIPCFNLMCHLGFSYSEDRRV